jgi:nitrogenase molybdenum-iron protein NifN
MNRSGRNSNDILHNTEATRNACKLCTPLGAALFFKGIRGAVPLLHGSQGCSTYIRRYLISHFREPVDIACSNFSEETAIFGGAANLELAIENISRQYEPEMIGVATTCLSETIGDDVPRLLREFRARHPKLSPIVDVSSPSYRGTHMDGFHGALRETVSHFCRSGNVPALEVRDKAEKTVNLFPGMLSTADLRLLKQMAADFGVTPVLLPDYADTLDGPMWSAYQRIPEGGTPVADIRSMTHAASSIEFGSVLKSRASAGKDLEEQHEIACHSLSIPVGVTATDRFVSALEGISGRSLPEPYAACRGRLIDAYADGHKYISGLTAAIYGEEDLVCALAGFAAEIGIVPILCATGANSGRMGRALTEILPCEILESLALLEGADFVDIEETIAESRPDLLIGSGKGYPASRRLNIPLVRVGFPIHDRFGGQRILHVGYEGAQALFDRIVNTVIETRQKDSEVGYTYM